MHDSSTLSHVSWEYKYHVERYRRRESSVEEALIEMYLAGISARRIEDVTEALWGTRVSFSTISNLNKKVYGRIKKQKRMLLF